MPELSHALGPGPLCIVEEVSRTFFSRSLFYFFCAQKKTGTDSQVLFKSGLCNRASWPCFLCCVSPTLLSVLHAQEICIVDALEAWRESMGVDSGLFTFQCKMKRSLKERVFHHETKRAFLLVEGGASGLRFRRAHSVQSRLPPVPMNEAFV